MFKKIEKVVVEEETVETPVTEVEEVVKPKMTLKKKLMIGGGVILGLGLGALALMLKKGKPEVDGQVEFDGAEEQELIAMEQEEAELTQTEF